MNLFFNTLNLLLLWISSNGAEQQAVRNGNHESGKVKLTTSSMKAITKGETGMCVWVGVGSWLGADGREEKKTRVKKETLDNTQFRIRRRKFKKLKSNQRDKILISEFPKLRRCSVSKIK